tara:strand:+ start:126 stop:311 length:186 start_codon:yes stop_codon:yes gene_type:complete
LELFLLLNANIDKVTTIIENDKRNFFKDKCIKKNNTKNTKYVIVASLSALKKTITADITIK